MTETEATSLLSTQDDQGVDPVRFQKVTDYTTFSAEHAFDGNDIVFHFFRTVETTGEQYWKHLFPDTLSEIAQEIFQAEYPRLKAAFTQEQDSWWMRATGFVDIGLPEERIAKFYEKLDQMLEARKVSVSGRVV